jgi:hypothetical protein
MRRKAVLPILLALGAVAFLATTEAPIEDPGWWLTNETPPRVALEGPAGPLRGPAEGILRLDAAARARVEAATVDGRPATVQGARVVVDSAKLPDGPHRVVVTARDTSLRQNPASAEWAFISDNTGPALDVRLDPPEGPVEGHTLVVHARPSEPAGNLDGALEGRDLHWQPDGGGGFWALAGIPPEPTYRTLALRLHAADALGNQAGWDSSFPLVRTRFPEEVLAFDPGIDYLAEARVRAEEDARLMPVYRGENGPKRWDGPFRPPVEGPITTEFATRRSYNNRFPQGNHAGVDYGAPGGAPVSAPAAGVVTLAARTPVRGNVLVLDHGAGVYSTYAHLERFEVDPGQAVAAGQVIARVGSTGLSTGPHLHWEVWVDEANVDPLEWTRRAFP